MHCAQSSRGHISSTAFAWIRVFRSRIFGDKERERNGDAEEGQMSTRNEARCRACGARVFFARTKYGCIVRRGRRAHFVNILHDDWCDIYRNGFCNCAPDFRVTCVSGECKQGPDG
jgi:hypothetical protein